MLDYNNVFLVPQYCDIENRDEIDISSKLTENISFKLPIISAAMDTVTEGKMAIAMANAGAIGCIHRYLTIEHQAQEAKEVCAAGKNFFAAINTSGDYIERATELEKICGLKAFVIDVAHGNSKKVFDAVLNLKKKVKTEIISGNVATYDAIIRYAELGITLIKVGVAGGNVCQTRNCTGFCMPALEILKNVKDSKFITDRNIKLIADGGANCSGDIIRALAFGASAVIAGRLLAGTTESPGKIIHTESGSYKSYRGMSSKESLEDYSNNVARKDLSFVAIEGTNIMVSWRGSVIDVLQNLSNGIRQGFYYAGARDIESLQESSIWCRISS